MKNKEKNNQKIKLINISLIVSLIITIFGFLVTIIKVLISWSKVDFNYLNQLSSKIPNVDSVIKVLSDNPDYQNKMAQISELQIQLSEWLNNFTTTKNIFVLSNLIVELLIIIVLLVLIKKINQKIKRSAAYKLEQLIFMNLFSIGTLIYLGNKLFITSMYNQILKMFVNYNLIYSIYVILFAILSVITVFFLYLTVIKLLNNRGEYTYEKVYLNFIKPIFIALAIYALISLAASIIVYLTISYIIHQINFVDWVNLTDYLNIDFNQTINQLLPPEILDVLKNLGISLPDVTLNTLQIPDKINIFFDQYVLSNFNKLVISIFDQFSAKIILAKSGIYVLITSIALISNYCQSFLKEQKFYGYLIGSILLAIIVQINLTGSIATVFFYALIIMIVINILVIVSKYKLLKKVD